MATWSGSPKASLRGCINAGRSSSPIVPSSRTCGKIWPNVTPLRQFYANHIFNGSSGKLPDLCQIDLPSWAIHAVNWVRSDPEMSVELGNFWTLSSWPWGAAGAALAVRLRVLASCIRKILTSTPDSQATWVIATKSPTNRSEVPSVAGLFLAMARLFSQSRICHSIVERSHVGSKKYCVLTFVNAISYTLMCSGQRDSLSLSMLGRIDGAVGRVPEDPTPWLGDYEYSKLLSVQ